MLVITRASCVVPVVLIDGGIGSVPYIFERHESEKCLKYELSNQKVLFYLLLSVNQNVIVKILEKYKFYDNMVKCNKW